MSNYCRECLHDEMCHLTHCGQTIACCNFVNAQRYHEIMQAEREGRLVVLPCRIDTPIYLIHQNEKQKGKPITFRVDECQIDHFTIGGTMIPMITACPQEGEWDELIDGSQKGYEYFLAREEAEKALEEAR